MGEAVAEVQLGRMAAAFAVIFVSCPGDLGLRLIEWDYDDGQLDEQCLNALANGGAFPHGDDIQFQQRCR